MHEIEAGFRGSVPAQLGSPLRPSAAGILCPTAGGSVCPRPVTIHDSDSVPKIMFCVNMLYFPADILGKDDGEF